MANKGLKFPAEVLNRGAIKSIIESFPGSVTGTRNRALIVTYLRTLVRCNEALDLRPTDIDFDRASIVVRHGKGGKRRVVAADEFCRAHLREWMKVRPQSEFLFCTHKGRRLKDSYVRRMLKRHAAKAGISHRVHVHGLRHSGACELAEEGYDLRLIQKQLGHSSLAVTSRYLDHLNPHQLFEILGSRGAGPTS